MIEMTKEERIEAVARARLIVERNADDDFRVLQLARLALLLMERGQLMCAVYAAALEYAASATGRSNVSEPLAWQSLRAACLKAGRLEQP